MSTCVEPGCGGTIAADGYCDTCGSKAQQDGGAQSPAPPLPDKTVSPAEPATQPPAAVSAAGRHCGRDGCLGTIARDNYCDTCGLAAESVGGPVKPPSASVSAEPSSIRSIAAPRAIETSRNLPGAGTATARSRLTTTSRRTGSARSGIGAGLVVVPPTIVGDPAAAVLSPEQVQGELGVVPEQDRNCSSCGRPVGRSTAEREGRVKGFCGNCRTGFDFVTNEPSLATGELVGGQYEILGPLAHGGMGWIYLGRDRAVSNRWVVLKGLLNEDDTDAVAAAVAERQFLAQIEHANIVNIYNFVTHRGAGYIVMEMVGGESLNAKLKQRREANQGIHDPLPVAEAIAYILGVLPAFGYLHSLGLVYNDLKPANVMAVGDEVKLIDVGAVMQINDDHAAIFGTQGFQAPEVAQAGPSISSDLFTVGRTLAVLIIRFQFHDGEYRYAIPPPEEEPLFAKWESLYRFLLRATAYHPDDRFQSAEAMAEQLTGVLREIVSLTEGRPRTSASSLFEGDQLANLLVSGITTHDARDPDWRVLPDARVNEEDPAAPFLLALPEADPARSARSIQNALAGGQLERSDEVNVRLAWELIVLRQQQRDHLKNADHEMSAAIAVEGDPMAILQAVEKSNPWDWRVHWYRSIYQLQLGQPDLAAEGFSRVWTELPGETAPKLGVALAAEMAGKYQRALELYDLVIGSDSSYVSAAFGLARCNWQLSNPQGIVDAYNRVPTSSAAHYDAQLAAARTLVAGGPSADPSFDDLAEAASTIERLQLDAAQRAELSAEIFERVLIASENDQIPAGTKTATLLGQQLSEPELREGLEMTYREMARLATTKAERIRLIDRANSVRARSLV